MKSFFQGDVAFIPLSVFDPSVTKTDKGTLQDTTKECLVVAEGEVTGHLHGIFGERVAFFRDDAMARSMNIPDNLYIGNLRLEAPADVRHVKKVGPEAYIPTQDHDAFNLPAGEYVVKGQREFDMNEVEKARRVLD